MRLDERALKLKNDEDFRFQDFSLTACYINIQSFNAHIQDLQKDEQAIRCDIIGLGETWLESEPENPFPDYFATYSNQGRGRGVACFCKEKPYFLYHRAGQNYTFLCFKLKSYNFIFTYISSRAKFTDYMTDLNEMVDKNERLILVGDGNVNADISQNPSHPFITFMKRKGFAQLVKKASHDEGHIIDVVYIKSNPENVQVFQKPVPYSDHDLLFIGITKELQE